MDKDISITIRVGDTMRLVVNWPETQAEPTGQYFLNRAGDVGEITGMRVLAGSGGPNPDSRILTLRDWNGAEQDAPQGTWNDPPRSGKIDFQAVTAPVAPNSIATNNQGPSCNITEFNCFKRHFGTCAPNLPCDFNGDGCVTIADWTYWVAKCWQRDISDITITCDNGAVLSTAGGGIVVQPSA